MGAAPAVIAVILLISVRALACSGPGAARVISENEVLGWALWGATIVVGAGMAAISRVRARAWRPSWPLLLMIVIHPGWWMSARSGDCGYMLREGSILVTAATLLVGGFVYWRARRADRPS